MVTLFIASSTENAGKTMLCAGLGKLWQEQNKQIGYLRPSPSTEVNKDAQFMSTIFDFNRPVESLCLPASTSAQLHDLTPKDKDITIVEGLIADLLPLFSGSPEEAFLIIHDYSKPLTASLAEYTRIKPDPLGIIINKVPRKDLAKAKEKILSEMADTGIKLLGLIPEERILAAPSIADLAEAVQGKILNDADSASNLIENIMVGASTFDRGAAYYSRKDNKAVILWGERPGFRKAALSNYQLAAMQTSTRCLIVSHNGTPVPPVAAKTAELKIPFVSAPGTVPELVNAIEKAMENLKFHQEARIPRLIQVLCNTIDLKQINI